tara:strand:+ start:407 stop:571 length:165 start_codon:yes stop_codon:yes gene_type:complete
MNKYVDVITTPLVAYPIILIVINVIIYEITGKKVAKIWRATTAIWAISAVIYVW